METISASALQLAGVLRGTAVTQACGDRAHQQAEAWLTVVSGTVGMKAMSAAVKVHAAGSYDEAAQVIAGPVSSPQDQTARDKAIVAEVACAMTVCERSGSALLGVAHRLTTFLL